MKSLIKSGFKKLKSKWAFMSMASMLILGVVLMASSLGPKQSENFSKNKFEGKYSYGTNANEGPVGVVYLYPISDKSSYFYLELCKGKPSYNSRELSGTIELTKTNEAVFKEINEKVYVDCAFQLVLKDDKIQITTDPQHDACFSFGSFSVNGIYKCKSSERPVYYIDRHGDTIYFENMVKMLNKKK